MQKGVEERRRLGMTTVELGTTRRNREYVARWPLKPLWDASLTA